MEQAMKIYERVVERRLRQVTRVSDSQCGFMPGRSTIDAIFCVRQCQEKFLAKGKKLWHVFVDLEKAFDRVPRAVVEWALRKQGVTEELVKAVMAMYEEARTVVRCSSGVTDPFQVRVGLHQGSVLSPLRLWLFWKR